MMKFAFVGSGSKGNASLIYTDSTLIQVDMGLPICRIDEALEKIGRSRKDIQGLFITHDHRDHIGTIYLYHDTVPVYATKGTYITNNIIKPGESVLIGDLKITPFSTSHDATDPVGYVIEDKDTKLGYLTDSGYLPDEAIEALRNCDYYLFESNHDYKMLMASKRPPVLKKRIHSDHGHLSNADSALYMLNIMGERTKRIFLAHLSEECNTPEKALECYRRQFAKHGLFIDDYKITPLKQWECVYGDEQ